MLLLLSVIIIASCGAFDEDAITSVVIATKQHFQSGCVYILHDLGTKMQSNRLHKMMRQLSDRNEFQVAILTPRKVVRYLSTVKCYQNRPLYVLTSQEDMTLFLQLVSSKTQLSTAVWLMFLEQEITIENFFNKVDIPFDCEFLISQQGVLTEVYRVGPTLPLRTRRYGNLTASGGFSWPRIYLYQRRNNLQGLIVKTGTVKSITNGQWIFITKEENGKPIDVGGYFGEIWHVLENTLAFRSDYYQSVDNQYGICHNNTTGSGLVGMIVRNEVHISNVDMFWTEARDEAIDFINPLDEFRLYMFIRRPETTDLEWNNFLKPFSCALWMMLFVSLIMLSTTLTMTQKIYQHFRLTSVRDESRLSFLQSLSSLFGVFCYQGQKDIPTHVPCRIVYLTAFITAVVMVSSYSASLISSIMTFNHRLPFRNFQEFLNDGTFQLGVEPDSPQYEYFKLSKNKMLSDIYKNHIFPHETSLPSNMFEGIQRVCDRKKYAALSTDSIVISNLEKLHCTLKKVPNAYFAGSVSMVIQKRSPYLGLLKRTSRNMLRNGMIKILRGRTVKDTITAKENGFNSVSISQLIPMFVVLAAGAFLSILFLMFERVLIVEANTCRRGREQGYHIE